MTGEQAQAIASVEVELDADDRPDPGDTRRLHEADGPVQPVAIAQSQRLDAQARGGRGQGAGRRRTLQEGVVRTGGEFREGHLTATTYLCNYAGVWWSSLAA